MNLVLAQVERVDDALVCVVGDQRLPAPRNGSVRGALEPYAGSSVALGIRAEDLIDPSDDRAGLPRLCGHVAFVEFLGSERMVRIKLRAQPVMADEVLEIAKDIDAAAVSDLYRGADAETALITARFAASSGTDAGDMIDVSVDTDRLHFFDPRTGQQSGSAPEPLGPA
jgi:multiple sugar transport system ATP-binding protein